MRASVVLREGGPSVKPPVVPGEGAGMSVTMPVVLGEGGRGDQEEADDHYDEAFHESPFGCRLGSRLCGVRVLLRRSPRREPQARHTIEYRHESLA